MDVVGVLIVRSRGQITSLLGVNLRRGNCRILITCSNRVK